MNHKAFGHSLSIGLVAVIGLAFSVPLVIATGTVLEADTDRDMAVNGIAAGDNSRENVAVGHVDNDVASGGFASAVSADCCYLHNNPTPPTGNTASQAVLPIDGELPTALTLYNYDIDRDANPGLRLDKTNQGLLEPDTSKYQVWRSGVLASDLSITGTVLIDIFGAMENYVTALVGAVTVFLRDYDPGTGGHTEIIDGTVFARDWQEGAGDFVERMALVLGASYTVPAGHELEAWIVVEDQSGQAMWLAYDTDNRPSAIDLTYTPPLVSSSLYFHNNPTPPTGDTNSQLTLPLSSAAPTATTLFNYDQERDGDPGLLINKGTLGLSEIDPSKFQVWRSDTLNTAWTIKGDVIIDVWMSLKGNAQDKRGVTTLYLRDYDPILDSYTEIGPASFFDRNWQRSSSTWVKKSILVPGVDHTLPAGHMLEARLTVENQSEDAMWVAYDTTSQPTVMSFPLETAVPVFEATPVPGLAHTGLILMAGAMAVFLLLRLRGMQIGHAD